MQLFMKRLSLLLLLSSLVGLAVAAQKSRGFCPWVPADEICSKDVLKCWNEGQKWVAEAEQQKSYGQHSQAAAMYAKAIVYFAHARAPADHVTGVPDEPTQWKVMFTTVAAAAQAHEAAGDMQKSYEMLDYIVHVLDTTAKEFDRPGEVQLRRVYDDHAARFQEALASIRTFLQGTLDCQALVQEAERLDALGKHAESAAQSKKAVQSYLTAADAFASRGNVKDAERAKMAARKLIR